MALVARRRRQRPGPSLSALTAASAVVAPEKWGKITKATGSGQDWQNEAWQRVKEVGELRFALKWKRALISRMRLVASDIGPDGTPTGSTDDAVARDIVAQIAGGVAGQGQLLGRLAVLLTVPGEGYIAVVYRGGDEQWHVVSRKEITQSRRGRTQIALPDGDKHELDPDTDTLARIWEPDDEVAAQASSDVQAALPILREIVRMSQNIEGAGKSRLAGNGILVLPEEVTMPLKPAPVGQPLDPDAPALPTPAPAYVNANDVRVALQNAMNTAIGDPTAAEGMVPIVLMTKGEYIKDIRHVKFDTEVSEKSTQTREKAIRRLALSLDMPAEVLLGQADLNHWSLWGVESQALRWHSEPTIESICGGITEQLFRPLMEAAGRKTDTIVWYDPADVEGDPEEIRHVREGYVNGVVTAGHYCKTLGVDTETGGYDLATITGWSRWAMDAVRRKPTLLTLLAPLIELEVGQEIPLGELTTGGDGTENDDDSDGVSPPGQGDTPQEQPADEKKAAALIARLERELT